VNELEKKIKEMIEESSQQLDSDFENDLEHIMKENNSRISEMYPEDSFQRLFWKQQL